MDKTKIILGISVLALAGAFFIAGSNGASAYRGDPSAKGPNYNPERHAAMQAAFESNDYNAWRSLVQGEGRATQVINESNFARFAEMHKLMEQGKFTEANAIRKELGLGLGSGQGRGMGRRGGCNKTAQ